MTHFRQYFDSEYLGSWDLPKGRETVVVIDKVTGGVLTGQKGRKDKKVLLTFRGKKKLMAANVTNCKLIAGIYGNDVRGWIGKPIALYVAENVDSPNGPVDAIRVRPRAPSMPTGQQKPHQVEPPLEVSADNETNEEWTPPEPPPGALESDHEQSV